MKSPFSRGIGFFLLFSFIALFSVSSVYLFFDAYRLTDVSPQTNPQQASSGQITPTPSPNSAVVTPTALPQPCRAKARNFEMGVAFPQWGPAAYGGSDGKWLAELPEMRVQTDACWVQVPVLLFQSSATTSRIGPGPSTPTLGSFIHGIQFAHSLGLHVFVAPLLSVYGPESWAGSIQFTTHAQEVEWFTNYWRAFKPYVVAAQEAGVEQFSIATEDEWLQANAPASLWNGLIANFRSVFSGTLTYSMNWSSLATKPPAWMHNRALKMIGISTYLSLIDTPVHVDPRQIAHLWAEKVKTLLDTFARAMGEPIFLSEIGYPDSASALYQPWNSAGVGAPDQQEQAAACAAALSNILPDKLIAGSFFWGWDDAGALSISGLQAVQTIQQYYHSFQA